MAIKLADKGKDRTSGFSGIVHAISKYLYGCTAIGVKSEELKDGKPMMMEWFDEQSLDALAAEPGGPALELPPQRSG